MRIEEYEATLFELKKVIKLADKDKVICIENEEKAVIIVELTKKLQGS